MPIYRTIYLDAAHSGLIDENGAELYSVDDYPRATKVEKPWFRVYFRTGRNTTVYTGLSALDAYTVSVDLDFDTETTPMMRVNPSGITVNVDEGYIEFQLNTLTPSFYEKVGTSELLTDTQMEIKQLEAGTGDAIGIWRIPFYCGGVMDDESRALESLPEGYPSVAEIQAMIAECLQPDNYAGEWALSTAYEKGQWVSYRGGAYVSLADHVSSATDEPEIGASWETYWGRLSLGLNWEGAWATATAYGLRSAVTHNGSTYVCTSAHTSGSVTEPGTGGSWETVWDLACAKGDTGEDGQGITWAGSWLTATGYTAYDLVQHGGNAYLCTSAHTSGSSTEPGVGASWETVWDVFGVGTVGIQGETGECKWVDADGNDDIDAGTEVLDEYDTTETCSVAWLCNIVDVGRTAMRTVWVTASLLVSTDYTPVYTVRYGEGPAAPDIGTVEAAGVFSVEYDSGTHKLQLKATVTSDNWAANAIRVAVGVAS